MEVKVFRCDNPRCKVFIEKEEDVYVLLLKSFAKQVEFDGSRWDYIQKQFCKKCANNIAHTLDVIAKSEKHDDNE